MRILFAVAVLSLAGRTAQACAACSCGDPTLTVTGVERPYRNRLRLSLDVRYSDVASGIGVTSSATAQIHTTLALSWAPHERVTLLAVLPWVTGFRREGGRPASTVEGLGNLELSVRVVAFRERRFAPHHLVWLSAGLKSPTGYRAYDDHGYPFPDDEQPGSGSFDALAGVTYAWFSTQVLSFFASAQAHITTPGWHGYHRGSSLGGSLVGQIQPWPRVAFQLVADGGWHDVDRLGNGAAAADTGGALLFGGVALVVNPWRDMLVRVAASAPAVQALIGRQSVGPQAGVQISYDFK